MRIGIVGAGVMGSTHAASWSHTPARITGLISADREQTEQVVAQYGGRVYESVDKLISDVDVVDICTPTHLHHEIALAAIMDGKDIVCEKPLARTIPHGLEMVDRARAAGVKLLVAHVVRFFPQYALAKAIVDRGDIGNVGVVRLTRASFQPQRGVNSWFHDVEKSGGMMLDLMIHDFDYARWVAGEVESVFAKSIRSTDIDARGDYAHVILRHRGGALSHIEGAWAYPPPMSRTALEIAGDQGVIEQSADSSVPLGIYFEQEIGDKIANNVPPMTLLTEDPYTTQIKHFYDILSGKEDEPLVTAADGLAALQISLATIRSAAEGRPVWIEEMV